MNIYCLLKSAPIPTGEIYVLREVGDPIKRERHTRRRMNEVKIEIRCRVDNMEYRLDAISDLKEIDRQTRTRMRVIESVNREPIIFAEFFGAALFKSGDVVFGGTYFNYEYAFVYLERKLQRNCRGFIPQFQANILSFLAIELDYHSLDFNVERAQRVEIDCAEFTYKSEILSEWLVSV